MTKTSNVDVIVKMKDIAEKTLAQLSINAARVGMFDMKDKTECQRLSLYLYLYAIDSWRYCESDPSKEVTNFMTEQELLSICANLGTLIDECCIDCSNLN